MGRRSITEKIIDSLEEAEDDSRLLVCYDFDMGLPLRRFYSNRDRLISRLEGNMIQYSVFLGPIRASTALYELVRTYGATVSKFKVENEVENIV